MTKVIANQLWIILNDIVYIYISYILQFILSYKQAIYYSIFVIGLTIRFRYNTYVIAIVWIIISRKVDSDYHEHWHVPVMKFPINSEVNWQGYLGPELESRPM